MEMDRLYPFAPCFPKSVLKFGISGTNAKVIMALTGIIGAASWVLLP